MMTLDAADCTYLTVRVCNTIEKALHDINGNGIYEILIAMKQAAKRNEFIHLEDITVWYPAVYLTYAIAKYFVAVRPPLRILKVPIDWDDCVEESLFIQSLGLVQETITELELKVDCTQERSDFLDTHIEGDADFYLNGRHFPSLTHFKIVIDFEMGSVGKMLSFNLNHLSKMPKIKEFFFWFKNPETIPEGVAEIKIEISEDAPTWINEDNEFVPENDVLPHEIHFDPILKDEVEGDGFVHLKSFHFHRNLQKSALQLLGKWTKNLQNLETVLDDENFSVVMECWPRLHNLKSIQGSKLSGENYVLDLQ